MQNLEVIHTASETIGLSTLMCSIWFELVPLCPHSPSNLDQTNFCTNHLGWWFQTSLRSHDVTIMLGSINHMTFCLQNWFHADAS